MGYFGLAEWHRGKKQTLTPISDIEFVNVMRMNNKIKQIIISIREIDRDHNGYVTNTELDDILKLHYPDEFGARDLSEIINKFRSISNKILIDYKQF